MKTQIDSFRNRIKDASQADSHAGERISHREAKQALAELKGAPASEANLAVKDVLESARLTPGGRKALQKFLGDNGAVAPRSAKELRELFNRDAQKRSDVITAAWPKGYPKMTPAVIGAIRDLDGKTYEVTVELVRFYDKKVVGSRSVLVDVDPFKVWSNARIGPFGPESPAMPDPTFDTAPAVIG
ncbi:MAG: hypothetical protein HYS27_08945 [Deltaproteobacteria bacterium]|nr:hypothetical protein [Deltaproteobacteria bacterium]